MDARKRPAVCKRHCYHWRWHHLPAMFLAFMGLGFALAVVAIPSPRSPFVSAGARSNVMGWAWADSLGWVSLNDQNPSAPAIPHGVNVDSHTGELSGFGISEQGATVCFGRSCAVSACSGPVPDSVPPYHQPVAHLEETSFTDVRHVHGWAKACSLGSVGWVSLDCSDLPGSACESHPYGVSLDLSTSMFDGAGWGGNEALPGVGFLDFRWAYLSM